MKSKAKARAGPRQNSLLNGTGARAKNKPSRLRRMSCGIALASGVSILMCILLFIVLNTWPAFGAQGADFLRSLIGDKAVAGLEMKVNLVQDGLQKLKYQMGMETPAAPWNTLQPSVQNLSPTAPFTRTLTSIPELQTPTAFQPTATPAIMNTPQPAYTPTPSVWQPAALIPLGKADGEGVWSEYIQDAEGVVVAYRTFLQPDPARPYTLVAVVAMDLTRTRLHFVLGTIEPAGENNQPRSGAIPQADRVAKVLLAAFNGGFKARHGQFGAMSEGLVALPPRDGLGTLMIYKSGRVSLEEWGPGSVMPPNVAAYRQNGPLVVQEGESNPRIHNNSPQDWGYTVNDVSPTVRTGIGLSLDEKTLFYFCGPSLSMEMLAKSMQAAGAWNAIQLDINNYWALFVKFQAEGSNLVPEALLPRLMVANIERYLWNYSRDYFYLTSAVK
jgi:hypothetical protein